jgi:molybdate transport system substrate-binding protein
VLEYVTRGEMDAGLVYTTDLLSRPGAVKEAARPPQSSYSSITYPGAVVGASTQHALARAFLDLLCPKIRETLRNPAFPGGPLAELNRRSFAEV